MQFAVGVYMFVWSAMNPGHYFHLITHMRSGSGTEGTFPAAGVPGIPLGSYHLCIPRSGKVPVIVQFSLSLSFGDHSATLFNLSIPRIEPPVRSFRRLGFRILPRAGATQRIGAQRDEHDKRH